MEPAAARGAFRVGDWLVEPSLNRLSRKGVVHHLRPRLMDLLVYLAEHAGQVVSKDRILDEVWHRRFVAESVLSRSVSDLRQLLQDDAETPRFIETIAKRGYRLVAVVLSEPASRLPTVHAPAQPSIVVLPFVDMAPGHDQEYFCDGLAEELTNGLAQLPGVRVVARTSAFAFKGRSIDVREIGRQLGVSTVLEGGVQRDGNRLRVTVQMIDAVLGCHIWSRRFDCTAADLFAVEDETVRAVVDALRVGMPARTEADVIAGRTGDPEAHDLYLRGRHLSARRAGAALEEAARYFERAIEADAGYAAAHAALADCHAAMAFIGFRRPADAFLLARAAAERALALSPNLADAHAVLGHEKGMYEWNWHEAEHHFLAALDANPGHAMARVFYSHLLSASGRFEEAVAQTERACEFDPLAPTVQMTLGLAWYYAGEIERAIDRYLKVLEVDPLFLIARMHLGRAYAVLGRFDAAIEQYSQAAGAIPVALGFLASAWRRVGRPDRAAASIAELERLSHARYVGPFTWFVAHIGEPDVQLAWLTRAFDERDGPVALLNTDPAVTALRSAPAFQSLLDRLRLPPRPDRPGGACDDR